MCDTVSVAIRMRPLNSRELSEPASDVEWRIEDNVIAQLINVLLSSLLFAPSIYPFPGS